MYEEQKLSVEDEIRNIYANYSNQRLPNEIVEKFKELIKENILNIMQETTKRSILRDSYNSNSIEEKDLLSAIQKMGPKYKAAIGYHLIRRQHTTNKGLDMGVGGIAGNDEEGSAAD